MNFTGDSAKTKKQAERNAAVAAWSTLKQMPNLGSLPVSSKEPNNSEKQVGRDQNQVARRRMMRGYREMTPVIILYPINREPRMYNWVLLQIVQHKNRTAFSLFSLHCQLRPERVLLSSLQGGRRVVQAVQA